eukprot:GHUV01027404.1.p1 GENE.GHUV01027404.1~~GHUV01027404.1.p1  ORF type:complete len:402 (+),score=88.42 GHUV01027404.1:78-1283(+)
MQNFTTLLILLSQQLRQAQLWNKLRIRHHQNRLTTTGFCFASSHSRLPIMQSLTRMHRIGNADVDLSSRTHCQRYTIASRSCVSAPRVRKAHSSRTFEKQPAVACATSSSATWGPKAVQRQQPQPIVGRAAITVPLLGEAAGSSVTGDPKITAATPAAAALPPQKLLSEDDPEEPHSIPSAGPGAAMGGAPPAEERLAAVRNLLIAAGPPNGRLAGDDLATVMPFSQVLADQHLTTAKSLQLCQKADYINMGIPVGPAGLLVFAFEGSSEVPAGSSVMATAVVDPSQKTVAVTDAADPDVNLYVDVEDPVTAIQGLLVGQWGMVLGHRQSGKSTLALRMYRAMKSKGPQYLPILTSLNLLLTESDPTDAFFQFVLKKIGAKNSGFGRNATVSVPLLLCCYH